MRTPLLNSRVRAIITALLLVLLTSGTTAASAGNSAGIASTFASGARALGMGEACCGSGGDVRAMNYNPATLSTLGGLEVSGFYESRLADDRFIGFVMACPAGPGALGWGLLHYDSGDIELLTSDGDSRRVIGQRDYLATVAYAAQPLEHLGLGVGIRILSSTLAEEFKATGVAADAGWVYESAGGNLAIGGSATNIGGHLKYDKATESIPWSLRLGGAYTAALAGSPISLAVDVVKAQESDLREHVGIESTIGGVLALRVGYKFGYDNAGLTFGVGLRIGHLQLDHGTALTDRFADIHLTQMTYGIF